MCIIAMILIVAYKAAEGNGLVTPCPAGFNAGKAGFRPRRAPFGLGKLGAG